MADPTRTSQMREFKYGSRVLPCMLLVSLLLGLVYLIYSLPRLMSGVGLERSIGALFGLMLVGYFAWREGRGFFLARVTPAELELQYLFGSERVSRKHLARLELKMETGNIMDELEFLRNNPIAEADGWASRRRHEERARNWRESATKFRVLLIAHSGQEYVSARFDDEKQFFGLREVLFTAAEATPPGKS